MRVMADSPTSQTGPKSDFMSAQFMSAAAEATVLPSIN